MRPYPDGQGIGEGIRDHFSEVISVLLWCSLRVASLVLHDLSDDLSELNIRNVVPHALEMLVEYLIHCTILSGAKKPQEPIDSILVGISVDSRSSPVDGWLASQARSAE